MKKIIIIFLLALTTISAGFSQCRIIIRCTDPNIRTPVKVLSYRFSTGASKLIKEFEVRDSLFCTFVKQRIDSMKLHTKQIDRYYPDVRQQITIVFNGGSDTLFSDGSFAMEKNGKCMVFDKILQEAINKVIVDYEQTLPENERTSLSTPATNAVQTKKRR